MANIKGKIIITSGIILVAGVTTAIIFNHIKKKKILKSIYDKINDTSSQEGQQALLTEENQLLGSNAFDPNFWRKTSGTKPNPNLLMPSKNAREIARKIYDKIKGVFLDEDDEKGIVSEFKKLKSKGQVSQVASAYQNSPLNYGDLGRDTTQALTGTTLIPTGGWFDDDTYIKQLVTYINSLPN
jgi:hypothetical protein